MAVMMCAGAAGCDRMISVSLIPGGNEVAKADPDGYASEWTCCAGCKRFTCDRCLPQQGGRCQCGAPVRLFTEAERMQVARNLAARLPPLATAATGKTLYPLIKPADYPHRALVVSHPLPVASGGPTRADLPIVTLAENTPNGYVVLTKDDPAARAGDLLGPAIDRLLEIPRDLVIMEGGIAAHAGQDLAAELLLHEAWLRDVVGKQLGTNELWVVVPHRVAFYAVPKDARAAQLSMLTALVRTELERGPRLGHAPVSDLAFHVRDGKIVDAVPYALLAGRSGPSGSSGGAPPGGNWLAGLMGAFFGGVIGMGMGIGVISGLDSLVPTGMDGTVVLGLAAMIGGLGFLLGFRSNLR